MKIGGVGKENEKMDDLISRAEAIDELQKEIDEQTNPLIRCGIRLAMNTIDELPSADAPHWRGSHMDAITRAVGR